ncbi:MAG: response regulator transcription factor, partial [Oscillospiraceae bacterium]|nr:response regulator transcription factor [Oscillospiraceae bacterium]
INLPKKDGITLLNEIRDSGIYTPVILLTAKCEVSDKLLGFNAGADDYLTKPFDINELLARVRALTRRVTELDLRSALVYNDVQLNLYTMELSGEKHVAILTQKEAKILEVLISNHDDTVSKDSLIRKVWCSAAAEDNCLEKHISALRKKLKLVSENTAIRTTRGVGYSLTRPGHPLLSR